MGYEHETATIGSLSEEAASPGDKRLCLVQGGDKTFQKESLEHRGYVHGSL